MQERILAVLRRVDPVITKVTRLDRLTGGASQETWRIGVERDGGESSFILRRVPRDVSPTGQQIGPEAEAEIIIRAEGAGVPVPSIKLVLQPDDNLGRGFISDFVTGETLARRIQRDSEYAAIRPRLARLWGETLARIHAIDIEGLAIPVLPAREQLERLEESYRGQDRPSAVLELALRWLAGRVDGRDRKRCLVHADFRLGNIMIAPGGVAAVLDWELSHIGNPAEDLGWLTVNSWRFGNIGLPVGGVGTVEQLLEGYRAAGGDDVTMEDIVFWRAMGSLKWAIMCVEMSKPTDGAHLPPERAMIGRRVSECEIDLLDIMEQGGPA